MNAPPVRVLWRPGLGLAVWPWRPDAEPPSPGSVLDDAVELPSSLTDLLGGRILRHTVELRTPGGGRTFASTTAVGVPTAVQLLDRFDHLPAGGDTAFYRYVLAGVRAVVDAGAVAPGVVDVAGLPEARWLPLPTTAWRAWLNVVHGSAPPAVAENGGSAAITDFATEVLDFEVRNRITHRVTSHVDLIAGLAAPSPMPVSAAPGARGAWNDWLATVGPEAATLVLRLNEPADDPESPHDSEDGDRWRLEVCRHDATGDVAPVVPHRTDPHDLETITGDLASAVRAFGELSRADTDPHSLDFLLDTATVEDLFAHGATAIADAGVTVLLPRTIASVSPSLSLHAGAVPDGGSRPGFVGLDEISDFEWRLALGDTPDSPALTQSDLDELAQQHGNLVKVRGRWLRAEGAALTRAAAFVAAQKALAAADGEASTMAELLTLVADPTDRIPVPVSSVNGLGWLDDVARGGAIVPEPVTPPPTLHASLRPYQQLGLDWLVSLGRIGAGAVLADDMGLGKTVQVIALLTTMRADDPGRHPALVVCPMSVIGNWQREVATFAPGLRVIVHHGTGRSVDVIST
ncbi:SNF2 helicase-associated domain-containing protein, partial [Gordonia sp. (in: high G+C Gram-positive bacteria)]|uniref:SNF2 helicase-associated domain-containing protein n=1 Tax=Gordonia sp. (in: high G+C Gram-positive bacteria) TaxID=84139 RepID=UPI00333FBEF0